MSSGIPSADGWFDPGEPWMDAPNSYDYANHEQTSRQHTSPVSFATLPPEIRIQIWQSTLQPELVFLHEVLKQPRKFALPPVTQVNRQSRHECRSFYERVGHGPYFQFPKDIFICDPSIAEEPSNDSLDSIALQVQRLAFWDCFPDEFAVACPARCEDSLWSSIGRKIAQPIDFNNLWFPNLKELWVVKIGDVDQSWGIQRDRSASRQVQFQQLARQFRYWVKEGVLEMAPLDLNESDTKYLLQNGRCREDKCRQVNHLRPMMVSRVTFEDSPYADRNVDGSKQWTVIEPRKNRNGEFDGDVEAEARRMRWALVERVLFFMLRSGCMGSNENPATTPVRTRTIGST